MRLMVFPLASLKKKKKQLNKCKEAVNNYRDTKEQGKKKWFGPKIEVLMHQEDGHHRPQDV